jgi:hypothetical protein
MSARLQDFPTDRPIFSACEPADSRSILSSPSLTASDTATTASGSCPTASSAGSNASGTALTSLCPTSCPTSRTSGLGSIVEEPWLTLPDEFSTPSVSDAAFSPVTQYLPPSSVSLGHAVGRVHELTDFWRNLGESYATNIVAEGYKIPQVGAPNKAYREPNNRSAILELPWVRDEVARLLKAGCVVQVPLVPRCCNPLTVAYNTKLDGTIK